MKKTLIAGLLLCITAFATAQITYIGVLNHNTGTGSNNLFNNYVAVGQQCYIDWEVYADGMTNMEACGLRSRSRLILRRMGDNDPTSVVASEPIIIDGICGGKNGNNDKYYADLGPFITKAGRYSVEFQADLPNMTNAFGNSSTRTTYNYECPSAYYLSGAGGPTGNYYTPSGDCAGGPGLSDPVGGPSTDKLTQIFTTLKFFTVGEVGTYRQMVIFNSSFFDLEQGKFQPGNPRLPASLNGFVGIPADGICPITAAPALSIGGEINNFKRTDCGNADVTGAALFYRLYKSGSTPPAYTSFALNFKDDCAASPNGPEGNNFPLGGSCQNGNGILDQRWQTVTGVPNMLPPSFALEDTGTWRIDFYTETYSRNCSGTAFADQSTVNSTSFTVNNPLAPGSPCSSVVPLVLSAFTVSPSASNNRLNWKVEEAVNISSFTIQVSFDGYLFNNIGSVPFTINQSNFSFTDIAYPGKTVFYRLQIHELNGKVFYSPVVRVNNKNGGVKMTIISALQQMEVKLENIPAGKYQLQIFNNGGSLIAKAPLLISNAGFSSNNIRLNHALSKGIYHAVLRNETGEAVIKSSFLY